MTGNQPEKDVRHNFTKETFNRHENMITMGYLNISDEFRWGMAESYEKAFVLCEIDIHDGY